MENQNADTRRPQGAVNFDNQNRVVCVTGGSGGIGSAIVDGFAKSGAYVFSIDQSIPDEGSARKNVAFEQLDVTDESAIEALVERIRSQHGGIDVLVNNAAIQPVSSFVPLHELDTELHHRMLDVNISGYALMAKHVVQVMMKQRSGVIVNIASAQAHRTAREVPGYGPTKAANIMQARQWAIEYARDGVRVVSVSPGAIDTPLVRASLEKQGGEAELANRHPLGRIGKPDEIANAVLWLSSPGASFVTATDLEVDGGLGGFASFADPYSLVESLRQ